MDYLITQLSTIPTDKEPPHLTKIQRWISGRFGSGIRLDDNFTIYRGEAGFPMVITYNDRIFSIQTKEGGQIWQRKNNSWFINQDWEEHYLSIDVKTNGPSLANPVTSIGIFLGPKNLNTKKRTCILKKRFSLKPMGGQINDEETMIDFWAKCPKVLAQIEREANDPIEVLEEFKEFLQEFVEEMGPQKITIVTDCRDFDLGRLDYVGFASGVFTHQIRYMGFEGQKMRHFQVDPSERMAQIGPKAYDEFSAWLTENHSEIIQTNTHFPDYDAEKTYWAQIWCDSKL